MEAATEMERRLQERYESYYEISLILPDGKGARKARAWCEEMFGKIPLVDPPEKVRSRLWAMYGCQKIYDDGNARWCHRPSKNAQLFCFKDPEDAMAFKLRWMN